MTTIIHPVTSICPGQRWFSREGDGHSVAITGIMQVGTGQWDYEVHFDWYVDGKTEYGVKNAYTFQVRYFNAEVDGRAHSTSLDAVQRQSIYGKPPQ